MLLLKTTEFPPDRAPAYVANGLVGLRVGKNPFVGGTAMLNGFVGVHPFEKVESHAPAPYPLGADLRLGTLWLSQRPDLVHVREQAYDFASGELTTRLDFVVGGVTAAIEVVIFCSRTQPTLALQEIRVTVDRPVALGLRAGIDPAGLPGRCLDRQVPNRGWLIADGCLHWESEGGRSSCGAAYISQLVGASAEPKRDQWGHVSAVQSEYAFEAQPGTPYLLRQAGSLVPRLVHGEPNQEAIRLVRTGWHRGFEKLRADNRAAWAELWRGRVRLLGADSRWQDIADAAFFYVHSSVHPSSPASVGPWGLGRIDPYLGHVFWDCETFVFPPVLLTAPATARALLAYRSRCLPAARNNAALNGYRGAQFPWESGTSGDEMLPSWAASIFLEQHISLDVAFAFAQYAHATGDDLFIRQHVWPALEGVADWIASRVTETPRGFEILNITGIDEGIENIDNNGFVNPAATVILREAAALARRLGLTPPAAWDDIARRMFVPRDPQTGAILKHEGYVFHNDAGYPEPLAAFFPFGYEAEPAVEQATIKYYLGLRQHFMHLPMIISQVGVFAARQGDRQLSAELFGAGVERFVSDSYAMFIEWIDQSQTGPKAPPATPYLANMGGFLMACLYGLTGIQLGPGEPASWARHPVAMPALWDAIEVERIWVRGRPARLLARHGEAQARLER